MNLRVTRVLMVSGLGLAAIALTATTLPRAIAGSGGLWEVSRSATGANAERRCLPSAAMLAQWEHLGGQCTRLVVSAGPASAVIQYTCTGSGFGRSTIRVITPRTLRIETQGISQGYPFNYVLHARRLGNC